MKKLIFLLCLTALAIFIAAGCGDDDCPNCPSDTDTVTVEQEYLVVLDGYITLYPAVWFELDGIPAGGAIPDIDSFAVGDSVSTDIWYSLWWHAGDPYVYMSWFEDETAPYMYESGDLATITVWGDNRSSSATVVILDWEADATEMLVPSGSDTIVDPGNDMEFTWSRVALAEWYGVELEVTLDTGVANLDRNYFYYTYDTSFTVPSTMDGFDVVDCYLYAIPVTGPDPESGIGNWEGDYVSGKMCGIGGEDWARVAFVGGPTSKAIVQTNNPRPKPSAREILDGVLQAYK